MSPTSRAIRTAVVLLASLTLLSSACAAPEKTKREKRVERYGGPVIDLRAAYDPNDEEAFLKNAADPRIAKIAAVVIAPAGVANARALNDRVLDLQRREAKVVACVSVHPYDGAAALEEVDRTAAAGARLLALDGAAQRVDLADARVLDVVTRAGDRGMMVLLEGGAIAELGAFGRIVELASRAPRTRFIVGHMGLTRFLDTAVISSLRRRPGWADNLFLDLSGAATLFVRSPLVDDLQWVIRLFPDRVLFGSDFPHDTAAQAIDATELLGLTEGEQSMVMYANSAKLLGL